MVEKEAGLTTKVLWAYLSVVIIPVLLMVLERRHILPLVIFSCYFVINILFFVRPNRFIRKYDINGHMAVWLTFFIPLLAVAGGVLCLAAFGLVDWEHIDFTWLTCGFIIGSLIAVALLFLFKKYREKHRPMSNSLVYATTCIPLQFDAATGKFTTCLINNQQYRHRGWMFPGGHVNIDSDYQTVCLLDESRFGEVQALPQHVALEKARYEAGLKDITLLDASGTRRDREYMECYSLHPARLLYMLRINPEAACYASLGHKYHLDFTYIGEFSDRGGQGHYDRVFVDIYSDQVSQNQVRQLLEDSINDHLKYGKVKETADSLFYHSIPDMLVDAINDFCRCRQISLKT